MRLRHTFFLILAVHLTLVLVRSVNDPDIWWHLRTGQHIFAAGVPMSDIYSYTNFGRPWVAHEWLSEALMYAVFHLAGWVGLILFSSLTSALVFLYVAKHCQEPIQIVVVVVVVAQAASLVVLRDPRPRLATLAFSAVFMVTLRGYTGGSSARPLWLLPMLTVAWVNLHAGYFLGIGFVILAMLSLVLGGNRNRLPALAVCLVGCLVAVTINPHGWRMFSYPLETQFSPVQMSAITEWNAPDFRDPQAVPFLLLLLVIVATLALSTARVAWFDLLLLLAAAFISLRSKRHVSVLSLVAIPVLAEHAWEILRRTAGQRLSRRGDSRERLMPALLMIMVIAVHAPAVMETIRHPVSLDAKPVSAISFMQAQRLADNVFSRYEWNDFLIWTTPERKVFIDGRPDMYGDQFFSEYLRLYNDGENWQEIFERYQVRTAMVQPGSAIAALIKQNPDWSEVYRDNQAVIFTKPSK